MAVTLDALIDGITADIITVSIATAAAVIIAVFSITSLTEYGLAKRYANLSPTK